MTELYSLDQLVVSEWKKRLQHHYLSSSGAYGNQPLAWLDTTPEELALAVGYPDATQEEVLRAFMKLFSRRGVRRVLADKVARHQGRFAYDNFHYLVLGCFVTATPIGAGDNKDFRDRLGELLRDGQGKEQGVSGLNSLWEALAEWANKKSSLRKILLPDAGSYTQIGVALKLAYPSWEDLAAFKRILKTASTDFQNRYALVQHIRNHSYHLPESSQHRIAAHLEELVNRFKSGRAVENHPFWRIIERVLCDLQKTGDLNPTALLWRLSLDFYGTDESGVDVLIAKGSRRELLSEPSWEGSFEQFLSLSDSSIIPGQIQQLLMLGTILFFESPNGLWTLDDRPITDVSTIILTKNRDYIAQFKAPSRLAGGWVVSEPLDYNQAKKLTQEEDLVIDPNVATCEFSFEGGVQVRKGFWLKRVGYLPYINLPEGVQIEIQPEIGVRIENNVVHFDADKASSKLFHIKIHGESFYKSLSLGFLSHADRNTRWPSRPENGFSSAPEIQFSEGDLIVNGAKPINAGSNTYRLLDALEAIYAKAGGKRTESEILRLLKPALPKDLNPWDLLRSLEEAGWLEQDVSTGWRGRYWRALPPKLVKTSVDVAIVEGAIGQMDLELLEAEAKRLGIDYFFNAEHPWSVPVIGLIGEGLDCLAEELNWLVTHARQPLIQPAPNCWFSDSRTPKGRQLTSVWNAELGHFLKYGLTSGNQQMQLACYVRGDNQNLFYMTRQGQPVFTTSERLVALLEFARQTQVPLFSIKNGRLVRQAQWGYLPLCLAQWLRRTTAKQTGPIQSSDGFFYGYSVISTQLKTLQYIFGKAIGDISIGKKQGFIQEMANNRLRGQRSHWPINREQE